ncbi:unnamed protein product [Penicillium crustosum]
MNFQPIHTIRAYTKHVVKQLIGESLNGLVTIIDPLLELTNAVDAPNGLEEGVMVHRGLDKDNSPALRVHIEAGGITVGCVD